jgi:acyl-ACP thioesterase
VLNSFAEELFFSFSVFNLNKEASSETVYILVSSMCPASVKERFLVSRFDVDLIRHCNSLVLCPFLCRVLCLSRAKKKKGFQKTKNMKRWGDTTITKKKLFFFDTSVVNNRCDINS